MNTLGDAGASNDDESYTGEVSQSSVSLDYIRNKAREFQLLLNNLDSGYEAALYAVNSLPLTDESQSELLSLVDEFDSKRSMLRATAEAFNVGAAAFNAAGGRLPSLSIPTTLGVLPAIPIALIAAVGTAAALISWGVVWLRGLNERLATAQLLDAQDSPEARAELARVINSAQIAARQVEVSPWAALSNVAKWGAVAALAYIGYRAWTGRNSTA